MKAYCLLLLLILPLISMAQTTTWDGVSWSNGTPDNTIDVVITGSYDTSVHGDFTSRNLSVSATGSITITNDHTITVQTDLDNLGSFTVEDKGSLVMLDDTGTVFGNYLVKRSTPDYLTFGWTSFFSSPMIEEDSNITSIFNSDDVIFYWDTSVSPTNWVFIPHEESPGVSNKLGLGKGYAARADMTTGVITRNFTGQLNTGDISVPVYYSDSSTSPGQFGYNIIGNPYPSAIDWFAFKADNAALLSGTMYLWRQQATGGVNHASSYIALNALGTVPYNAANEFIGSAQGFVVKTNATSNVVFKNSHRVTNNQQFFRNSVENRLSNTGNSWLKLEGGGNKSTILIGFNPSATTGFDNDYDGIFIGGTDALQLYSVLGADKLLINGQPQLIAPNDVSIPLGFKSSSTGTFTISIDEEFIDSQYLIKLEDTETSTVTDLKMSDYTFSINSTEENNSRFIVHYEYDTTLTSQGLASVKESLKMYFSETDLNIILVDGIAQPRSISLYDVNARLVYSGDFKSKINTDDFSSGIYVVNLHFDDLGTVSKAVVKK